MNQGCRPPDQQRQSWLRRMWAATILSPLWWDALLTRMARARPILLGALALILLGGGAVSALLWQRGVWSPPSLSARGEATLPPFVRPVTATSTPPAFAAVATVARRSTATARAATGVAATTATRSPVAAEPTTPPVQLAATVVRPIVPVAPGPSSVPAVTPPLPTATLPPPTTIVELPTATAVPPVATPTPAPPPTPAPVPTSVPPPPVATPAPAPIPTVVPAPPPAASAPTADFQQRTIASEAQLRTGQFVVKITYANGTEVESQIQFDLGPTPQRARLYTRSTYRGATGTTREERLQIGQRVWRRAAQGRWIAEAAASSVADQVRVYLPQAANASGMQGEAAGDLQILRWYDPARDVDLVLTAAATTAQPQQLVQRARAVDLAVRIDYVGWNTDVTIPTAPTS